MSNPMNKWYVFGRKDAQAGATLGKIEPGTVYQYVGYARTRDAAIARRTELDVAGRAGIMVHSPSRQQAMADLVQVYDAVVVEGYISPANRRAGRAIVKSMVMREIFCPYTGEILDMRRAVVVVTPTASFVATGEYWDKQMARTGGIDAFRAMISDKLGRPAQVDVYDGRELFKR